MANEEQLAILSQGVEVWNAWRKANDIVRPDLREANLYRANLHTANLHGAYLRGVDLRGVNLQEANLQGATLGGADLWRANLHGANIQGANLQGANLQEVDLQEVDLFTADLQGTDLGGANLQGANLQGANLSGTVLQDANLSGTVLQDANLQGADLEGANLQGADLFWADLHGAHIGYTIFADVDLRKVRGLESVIHEAPSPISIDTLIASHGQIPEAFLRGCGVPDSWIEYLPSLIGSLQPIQFYSCFISYSEKDKDFAKRLHERMRGENLRVWFAPHDLKGGRKLGQQIDDAIRVYDKLLLILSEESMTSTWVAHEIRRAHTREQREGKRILFPIRLCEYESLTDWELPDGTGRDLALEVRHYYIPDFSHWKDHDTFETSFARLLDDLKDTAKP